MNITIEYYVSPNRKVQKTIADYKFSAFILGNAINEYEIVKVEKVERVDLLK